MFSEDNFVEAGKPYFKTHRPSEGAKIAKGFIPPSLIHKKFSTPVSNLPIARQKL
jgi:hypothetical protein